MQLNTVRHPKRSVTATVFVVASLALASGVVIYGAMLILVGQVLIAVPEVQPGAPVPVGMTMLDPTPLGIIPLLAGALVITGLLAERRALAWVGVGLIALFSALFMFGLGGILIPVAVALAVLLSVLTWSTPARSSS
jgi:hypothetical protein